MIKYRILITDSFYVGTFDPDESYSLLASRVNADLLENVVRAYVLDNDPKVLHLMSGKSEDALPEFIKTQYNAVVVDVKGDD